MLNRLFREGGSLHDFLENRRAAIRSEIGAENEDQLLNVNVTEYVKYLVEKYREDPIVLGDPYHTTAQVRLPGHQFPPGYDVRRNEIYTKSAVIYHVPFDGDPQFFRYHPLRYTSVHLEGNVDQENREVLFQVINFDDVPAVERRWQEINRTFQEEISRSKGAIDAFNAQLESFIRGAVEQRKQEILSRRKALEVLSVPFRQSPSPPPLTVPFAPGKVAKKPKAPLTPFQTEPALTEEQYSAVLTALHKIGVGFEKYPSTYKGKQEEELRDLILVILRLYYDHAAGEALNKAGKTDILVSYEGGNVFVAECKFWEGKEALLAATSQVLSYLTWRDSKAALLLFVRNVKLQPVLDGLPEYIREHPAFIKDRGRVTDGWYRFELHVSDDETRPIHLSILCFHLPSTKKTKTLKGH